MVTERISPFLKVYIIFYCTLCTGALKCFECSDMPSPRLCNVVTTCGAHTACEIEQYVTSGGLVLYRSGCTSNPQCTSSGATSLVGKRSKTLELQREVNLHVEQDEQREVTHGRRKREDITTCLECCKSDFCNNKGCGQKDVAPTLRGPYCFDCAAVLDLKHCNKIVTCATNEVCATKLNTAFHGQQDHVYSQGCSQKSCLSNSSPCKPSCCDSDFCNDNFTCIATSTVFTSVPPPTKHDATTKNSVTVLTTTTTRMLTTAVRNAVVEAECRKHISKGFWYDFVTGTCFQVNKLPIAINHYQALKRCLHENATLVTINSQYVQERILVWIFSHQLNDTNFWIGAKTHQNGSHVYYWPGGDDVTYNNWGGIMAGQPDDIRVGNENCVFLNNRDRYYWHDDECTNLKTGFICEIGNVTSGQKYSTCINKLFEGYTYDTLTDICIKFHFDDFKHSYTQSMAKGLCSKDGASLVSLDSAAKTNYVLQYIFSNRQNATDYWIGAEDFHNNNIFYWPTGNKVTYSHWGGPAWPDNQAQPDELFGALNRRCVHLNSGHNFHWFDRDCSQALPGYICQFFGNASGEVNFDACKSRLYKGYVYDRSSRFCISIHSGPNVTRAQAGQYCTMETATDLVAIDNQQKMDYIHSLLVYENYSATEFWIGGYDTYSNATFYWEPVNQLFNYTYWFAGIQPAPSDCALLDYQNKYTWTPTSCSNPINGYICEISQKSIG